IDFSKADSFFLCGPEEMIFSVKDELLRSGVDAKKIHFELFTTPGNKQTSKEPITSAEKSGFKSRITIRLDGVSFDFDLGFEESPILDAALKNGADLPYACKGGVCCTCRARLIE